MSRPLDNQERSRNAIVCFYIILAACCIMLISDFMEFQLLTSPIIGFEEADANDRRQLIVGVIYLIAELALIITFIQWFRRAFHNLHRIGEKGLSSSEGWAAGAWFIPIYSLFRPYQIMVEIWDRTERYIEHNSSSNLMSPSFKEKLNNNGRQLIGWWWAFWVISSIIANISFQIVRNASTIDTFITSSVMGLIADVASIVCVLFAVQMIKKSQKAQNELMLVWQNRDNPNSGSFNLADSDEILI